MTLPLPMRWRTRRPGSRCCAPCPPEQTLATVAPALPACGITRVASVTHLDTLGIPTWVSVRPGGQVLQISNGKGVTNAAAQASATMEACELHLAENPDPRAAVARQHGRAREGRARCADRSTGGASQQSRVLLHARLRRRMDLRHGYGHGRPGVGPVECGVFLSPSAVVRNQTPTGWPRGTRGPRRGCTPCTS